MLIPTSKNTKTITDLREDALEVLRSLKKNKLAYVFYKSKPKAVMLDIDEFVRLQEALEDYWELKAAKQLSQESRGKGIPLEEIEAKYT